MYLAAIQCLNLICEGQVWFKYSQRPSAFLRLGSEALEMLFANEAMCLTNLIITSLYQNVSVTSETIVSSFKKLSTPL